MRAKLILACIAGPVLFFLPALDSSCEQATAGVQFNTASAGARPADIEAAVAAICPRGGLTRSKDGSVSGCRTCPRGTDFYGQGRTTWEMYAETPGHFTSAKDENLLLDGTGCDSDASNQSGTFVFTLTSGKPRLVRYNKGLITDQCHKFVFPNGRDFLVCRGGSYLQGEGEESVFMVSLDAAGVGVSTPLISTTDTTGTCSDDSSETVRESDIKDIQFALKAAIPLAAPVTTTMPSSAVPQASSELSGLTITATLGRLPCAQVAKERKSGKSAPMLKTWQIGFVFDGRRFTVAPASRATLARFNR